LIALTEVNGAVSEEGNLVAAGRVVREPDDLRPVVDRGRLEPLVADSAECRADAAAEYSEIGHLPVLPQEGVLLAARRRAVADDLTAVVDRRRLAASAAESP
jgi:hypothetical protein